MKNSLPQLRKAWTYSSSKNLDNHYHNDIELFFVSEGKCQINSIDFNLTGKKNDLLILPSKTKHHQITHGLTKIISVYFDPNSSDFNSRARIVKPESGILCRLMKELVFIFNTESAGSLSSSYVLMAILEKIKDAEVLKDKHLHYHPSIEKAINYMGNHFNTLFTIAQLSRECGISESYLRNLFNRQMGFGPLAYLNNLRLEFAKEALKNPYSTILEVSNQCGFNDVNYFIRIYKKKYEITPKQHQIEFTK